MPITGDAAKVKKSMEKQYGKEEGERVFYATANKQKRKPETWKKKAAPLPVGPAAALGSIPGAAVGATAGAAVGILRAILSKRARQKHGTVGTIAHDLGMGALLGGGAGALGGAGLAASGNPAVNKLDPSRIQVRAGA